MEACRAAPAILYLPHLQMWWETGHATMRATLWMLLAGLAPDLPLLLLTTADVGLHDMDPEALQLFQTGSSMSPKDEQRYIVAADLLDIYLVC